MRTWVISGKLYAHDWNLAPLRIKPAVNYWIRKCQCLKILPPLKANFSRTGNHYRSIWIPKTWTERKLSAGWFGGKKRIHWSGRECSNAFRRMGKIFCPIWRCIYQYSLKDTAKKDTGAGGYVTLSEHGLWMENLPEAQTTVFTNATVWTNRSRWYFAKYGCIDFRWKN